MKWPNDVCFLCRLRPPPRVMRTANKNSYFGNAARRPRSPVLAMGGHADRTRRADENRRPASNLHYALVAVAAALVYLNSLDGGFAYDDR